MADDTEDRDRGAPSVYTLDKSVAVLRSELKSTRDELKMLTTTMDRRFDSLDTTVRDSLNRYATRDDLKDVRDELADVKRNITWGVRIVISAVIVGVLALIFKAGLLHA